MSITAEARERLSLRFEVLMPHLNERQRRLLLATEARLLGHGGVRAVARVAGVSETTVRTGVFELEEGGEPFPEGRARREGGGRKSAAALDAGLVPALLALVEPDERGDDLGVLGPDRGRVRLLEDGADQGRDPRLGRFRHPGEQVAMVVRLMPRSA